MAASKRVRWDCPNGAHPGVLGPRQPRRDSVVRYCLPCSEATGRLVERTAPAVERQRRAAAERAAKKAQTKRQRAATQRKAVTERDAKRYVVDGVDLQAEMRRLVKLRTFGGTKGLLARRLPTLTVTHRSYKPSQLGCALPGEWRIRMAIWPGMDAAEARETLVHELVHLAVYMNGSTKAHGDGFRQTMRAAWREAYGPDVVGVRAVSYGGPYAAALRAKEADE